MIKLPKKMCKCPLKLNIPDNRTQSNDKLIVHVLHILFYEYDKNISAFIFDAHKRTF